MIDELEENWDVKDHDLENVIFLKPALYIKMKV